MEIINGIFSQEVTPAALSEVQSFQKAPQLCEQWEDF